MKEKTILIIILDYTINWFDYFDHNFTSKSILSTFCFLQCFLSELLFANPVNRAFTSSLISAAHLIYYSMSFFFILFHPFIDGKSVALFSLQMSLYNIPFACLLYRLGKKNKGGNFIKKITKKIMMGWKNIFLIFLC